MLWAGGTVDTLVFVTGQQKNLQLWGAESRVCWVPAGVLNFAGVLFAKLDQCRTLVGRGGVCGLSPHAHSYILDKDPLQLMIHHL